MTQPPDPVAALADALCYEVPHSKALHPVIDEDRARRLHARLTAAGWSLSHDSEREALVERVAAALWDQQGFLPAFTEATGKDAERVKDGFREKARAAIEGRP